MQTEFVCPKCNAKNIKEGTDLGCACCGFGKTVTEAKPVVWTSDVCTNCHRYVHEAACTPNGHILLG